MTAVLHIASWYPNPWNALEAPFVKEHFDAVKGHLHQELWHVQVRDDGPAFGWRSGQTGEDEHYLILFSHQLAGRIVELLTLLLLFVLRLRLGKKWWDVVNVHVAYPLLSFPRLFRWLFGHRVVVNEHWSAYHRGFNLPPGSAGRRRIASIFHHGIPVVAVSKALLGDIVQFAGRDSFPSSVVPNVVDPCLFYPAPRQCETAAPVCLMVASWASIKRPLLAMSAFAEILQRWPTARLRIVGGGQQYAAMKDFVQRNGLGQQILLLGPLGKAAVAQEMRSADLFLHPSEYETFSVVCAEALVSGTPVIASDVGGIPEFVNDSNGLLVVNNVEAWRDALELALSDLGKWNRSETAKEARKRFAPEVVAAQLVDVYLSA